MCETVFVTVKDRLTQEWTVNLASISVYTEGVLIVNSQTHIYLDEPSISLIVKLIAMRTLDISNLMDGDD